MIVADTQSTHGDKVLTSIQDVVKSNQRSVYENTHTTNQDIKGLSAKLFERGQQPPVSAVVGVQDIETTGRRLSKTGAVCEMHKATTQCSKVMHDR
eukprot:13226-Heterococcus_DN1.PRE.2